jgi:hypothetical protein
MPSALNLSRGHEARVGRVERAQAGQRTCSSHFPVCAWSQTPILSLVSHLISRKKCTRRALDRTGATIRLWYLSAYGLVKSETFVGFVQLFSSRFPWQGTNNMWRPKNPTTQNGTTGNRNGHMLSKMENEQQFTQSLPTTAGSSKGNCKKLSFANSKFEQHTYPSFFLYRESRKIIITPR